MRSRHVLFGSVVMLVACSADQTLPTENEISVPLFARGGQTDFKIGTHLTGDEEVPPRATQAQGQAIFRLSADGTTANFRLIAANIENVFMAHIHCGCAGDNGDISVWLYGVPTENPTMPAPAGAGRHNGVLASGSVTLAGQSCTYPTEDTQCPESVQGATLTLLEAMREGHAYVNVHTNDGEPPTNTGPGDFPGGEIRGQLDHASAHGGI